MPHASPENSKIDSISSFDVMAFAQRAIMQNLVEITAIAAQQEVDLARSREAYDRAVVEKDDAIFKSQAAERNAEYERTHDSLTKLPNKAFLKEAMAERIAADRTIGVFAIDITGFKSEMNDKHGHDAGDRFLQSFSTFASTKFGRLSDVLTHESFARTGGDEFYLLTSLNGMLENESEQRATDIAQRAHNEHDYIHDTFTEFLAGSEWAGSNLAISVGYAIRESGDARTVEELLQTSDANMYLEKQAQHAAMGIDR